MVVLDCATLPDAGAHPRRGPRRLPFELGKATVSPLPSRSTIYRVLVRYHLVGARKR